MQSATSFQSTLLLIVPDEFTALCPGYLHELVARLQAAGVQVVLCILQPSGESSSNLRLASGSVQLNVGGCELPTYRIPLRGRIGVFAAAWKIAGLARQWDAVAVHGWTRTANEVAHWCATMAGLSVVLTRLDWLDSSAESVAAAGSVSNRLRAWVPGGGETPTSLLVGHESLVGTWQGNWATLPRSPDVPRFPTLAGKREPGVALRESLGIPHEHFVIVSCARFLPRNRLKDLLWAVDLLQCSREDFHFLLFGDGPQVRRLRTYAEQCTAIQRTRFVHDLEDLALWVGEADAYWHPYSHEPSAYLPQWARMNGTLVLAPRAEPEVMPVGKNDGGILFDEGQREQLARLTHAAFSDPERLMELKSAAAKLATSPGDPSLPLDWLLSAYRGNRFSGAAAATGR